jgi:hypothetical protein
MEHIRVVKYQRDGQTFYRTHYKNLAGEDIPVVDIFAITLDKITPDIEGACLRHLKGRIAPLMAEHIIFDLETVIEGSVEAEAQGTIKQVDTGGEVGTN